MKKTALVILICAAIAAPSIAQDEKKDESTDVILHLANEKKIEISDVPNNVLQALNRTAYKAEKVEAVFEILSNNEKFYKFIVQDYHGKRAVVFDEQGTMQSDRKEEE